MPSPRPLLCLAVALLLWAPSVAGVPPRPVPPPPLPPPPMSPQWSPSPCAPLVAAAALAVPSELSPPVADALPSLVAAGPYMLNLDVRFPCVPDRCPVAVFWEFKKDNATKWKDGPYTYMYYDVGYLIATTKLSNLEPETQYQVRVCPKVRASPNNQTIVPWCQMQNITCFPATTVVTCAVHPPPVGELTVHSAGAQWLALSWTPPAPACETQLYYDVDVWEAGTGVAAWAAATGVPAAGRFASHDPLRPEGRVAPCAAWPARHCLLLTATSAGRPLVPAARYHVQVKVRQEDDRESAEQTVQGETRDDIASEPPEDLHCTDVWPRNATVRWRAPRRPGGRVVSVAVLVRSLDLPSDASLAVHQSATLRADYSQQISDLEPNARYNVTVRLVTEARGGRVVEGAASWVELWTPPACVSTPEAEAAARAGEHASSDTWIWLAALALSLVLLPLAFFLGARSVRRKEKSHEKINSTTKLKSAGDRTSLYDAVQPSEPPCSTPPAAALTFPPPEYAEVQPVAQRAWLGVSDAAYSEIAAPAQRASCQSSHHYEVLEASAHDDPESTASVSPYAEVLLSSANLQLPVTSSYLYAQVNKKRKSPPPAAPNATESLEATGK